MKNPPRFSVLAIALLASAPLLAQQPGGVPPAAPATSIAARTAGLEKREGFFPLYLNDRSGQLLMEIPRDSARALLLVTLATGLGSNPIGIDRGSNGAEQIARFEKTGDRVFV